MAEPGQIGSYRIVRKIGEGGMGTVFVAEHALLGRMAAIKVLLPELSANRDIVQRFFNEARAVTQIADPGIVQVFDFGYHTDGSAFIVMELLQGEPMDTRLARLGRFHIADVLRLMRQITASLAVAHGKGVVHRDLKPENIFIIGDPAVTGGERTKILDFGIAKVSSEEPGKLKTRTGLVMGTPVFMSPEQCRGAGDIDHRADIYSLGCVMFCMLTGGPPFNAEGAGELIAAHLMTDPPTVSSRLPAVPPAIDEIVLRCLAKQPRDRYQSVAELGEALASAEGALLRANIPTMAFDVRTGPHLVATAPHSTLANAAGQYPSGVGLAAAPRRRWPLAAGLAGGLVLALAGAWFAMSSRAAPVASATYLDAPPPVVPAAATPPAPAPAPAPAPTPAATAPVDAGVPDAPTDAAIDAAPAAPMPAHTAVHHHPTVAHPAAQPAKPAAPVDVPINRGD